MDDRIRTGAVATTREGEVTFGPTLDGLTGIVVKGFLLSLITFGLYRFWYISNLRRFFWSRTVVDGSPALYVGGGQELFLGFLVAIVVLALVYVGLFAVSLLFPNLADVSALLSVVVLFVLGQFALYRGRRYRASRTLWRGIRLGQDGSGLAYAARASGWWILVIATLGLAYPFMRASLERYRIRHTLIGTSRLESEARGRAVLRSWLLLWVTAVAPSLVLLGVILALIDCGGQASAIPTRDVPDPGQIRESQAFTFVLCSLGTAVLVTWMFYTIGLGVLLGAALYPYYRAREIRAFMNATRLGQIRLVSRLKAWDLYRPYLSYAGQCLKLGVLITLAAAAIIGVGVLADDAITQDVRYAIGVIVVVALYAWYLLASVVLAVRVLKAGLWRAVAETMRISDADALGAIVASAHGASSRLGEGMADALEVSGAIEIGF